MAEFTGTNRINHGIIILLGKNYMDETGSRIETRSGQEPEMHRRKNKGRSIGIDFRKRRRNRRAACIMIALLAVMGLVIGAFSLIGAKQKYPEDDRKISDKSVDNAFYKEGQPTGSVTDSKAAQTGAETKDQGESGEKIAQDGKGQAGGGTSEEDTAEENTAGEDTGEENTAEEDTRIPVKVRGIYVTGPMAGTKDSMQELIDMVESTELNAMVIDIKNDSGEITYKMDLPLVQEVGAGVNYIRDIDELISNLKSKNIYLIARIVAFKDPILAEGRPELAVRKADGSVFRDADGLSWVNPYKKEVWDYLISVAGEAAELGFDEIQFDYIRFSTDSKMKNADLGKEAKKKSKTDVITEFTKYACEKLKPLGVFVSADVYGTIIDNEVDSAIVGQSYTEMSKYLDYICPMIYPSHYRNGVYGIEYPDLEPYNVVNRVLNKSKEVLKEAGEGDKTEEDNQTAEGDKAVVRPWLQDFTASWLPKHKSYGKKEIQEQIKGVYDSGYEEWILWNGRNNYTEEGLLPE